MEERHKTKPQPTAWYAFHSFQVLAECTEYCHSKRSFWLPWIRFRVLNCNILLQVLRQTVEAAMKNSAVWRTVWCFNGGSFQPPKRSIKSKSVKFLLLNKSSAVRSWCNDLLFVKHCTVPQRARSADLCENDFETDTKNWSENKWRGVYVPFIWHQNRRLFRCK